MSGSGHIFFNCFLHATCPTTRGSGLSKVTGASIETLPAVKGEPVGEPLAVEAFKLVRRT